MVMVWLVSVASASFFLLLPGPLLRRFRNFFALSSHQEEVKMKKSDMPQELFQLSWRRYVETSIALLAGVFTFYIGAVSTLFVKYAEFVLFLVGDDTPVRN